MTTRLFRLALLAPLLLAVACQPRFDDDDDGDGGDGGDDPACADVVCDAGVCDPATLDCVDPWALTCPEPGVTACADDQPWRCQAGGLPSYDCPACGCPDDQVCHAQVCFDPAVLELERQSFLLPDDLALDDYFALLDWAMQAPSLTFADFVDQLDGLLRADARRVVLLLGESHGSLDEQLVNIGLIEELQDAGWHFRELGMEDNGAPLLTTEQTDPLGIPVAGIAGGLDNDDYCAAAEAGARDQLADTDGLYAQYIGSGHSSQEVAHHPQHYTIVHFPHTAECVRRTGRLALTVIAFDPDIWLTVTDRTLLWKLGQYYPDPAAVSLALNSAIDRWRQSLGAQVADPLHDVTLRDATLGDVDTNVRLLPAAHAPDTWFAWFPRPNRRAFLLESFAVLWDEPAIQSYLLAHDIEPGNCSVSWNFTPGEETLTWYCQKDDFGLEAVVDGVDYQLESYSTE